MYKLLKQKHRCNLTKEELRKLDELRQYWKVSIVEQVALTKPKQQRKPPRVKDKSIPHQPSLF